MGHLFPHLPSDFGSLLAFILLEKDESEELVEVFARGEVYAIAEKEWEEICEFTKSHTIKRDKPPDQTIPKPKINKNTKTKLTVKQASTIVNLN